MDNQNILSITTDPEALDNDMQDWQSMCYGDRKRSDDACREKYGYSNTDLYNMLKDDIENEHAVLESDVTTVDTEGVNRLDQIRKSEEMEQQEGVVIITDWLSDDKPSYSPVILNYKYQQYLSLTPDIRDHSDQYSMNIWGLTVYNMYHKMLDKFNSYDYENMYTEAVKPDSVMEYVSYMDKSYPKGDKLQRKLMELSCLTGNTLYELSVLDRAKNNLATMCGDGYDYANDIPTITPWFTPDEMEDITGTEIDPYDHILGRDQVDLKESIRTAFKEGNTDELIGLGWNPSVPYTTESMSYARKRQINWFNENKQIQIVDLSKYKVADDYVVSEASTKKKKKLEPIYLVLVKHDGFISKAIRTVTNQGYSHAGLSLDDKMENIMSYNFTNQEGKPRLSIESMSFYNQAKNAQVKIMALFVDPKVKKVLKEKIDWFKANEEKTIFALWHFLDIVIKKKEDLSNSLALVCSQFTDVVLKTANIDITGKDSSLVTPGDFDHPKESAKLFTVFNGAVMDYDYRKTRRMVHKLLDSDLNPDGLITKPVNEALEEIFNDCTLESFFVKTGDPKVDKILSEIREILTPEAVITEAKPFPIRFNKSGDLYIDLPRDLEAEYQQSHRLLVTYNEDNVQGIKHQLARLFFINSIIEQKIKKMKKDDKDYKKLIDLRARVLNDYTKYMKVVQKIEPNFDFEQYLKNSEYYNRTIKIDSHTLKYSTKTIKDIISHMK